MKKNLMLDSHHQMIFGIVDDFRPKRRRSENMDIEEKLEKLILKVGDKVRMK